MLANPQVATAGALAPTHPKYRSDIDGLRAIAVLSVVAYHAYPMAAHGGFIGVDVFFVISGFLISSILFDNLRRGSFRFRDFYGRRVARIFPALALVLVSCLAFGYAILTTRELAQVGKHVAGGAGFVSNLVLWNESGYFDAEAASKPLLHLWSLGIEEQFYIFWPLALWAGWRLGRTMLGLTIAIGLASFALNVADVHRDAVATFYSPLTRAWELLAGAALAWYALQAPAREAAAGSRLRDAASLAGLAAIGAGLGIAGRGIAFPGWLALLPVVGAVLVIGAGRDAWANRKVLSHRVCVWFGLISFPLYLWHWPLLASVKILGLDFVYGPRVRYVKMALVALAVALAWATTRFVERPIRFGGRRRMRVAALVAMMTIVGIAGTSAWMSQGRWLGKRDSLPERLNAGQLAWNDSANDACRRETGLQGEFCMLYGNPRSIELAILGDSTANHLAPGLGRRLGNDARGVVEMGEGTCPPIRGLVSTSNWGGAHTEMAPGCVRTTQQAYAYVLAHPEIHRVILGFFAHDLVNWGLPQAPPDDMPARFAIASRLLGKDIDDLERHGKQVTVTYDAPGLSIDVSMCLRPLFHDTRLCRDIGLLRTDSPSIGWWDGYFAHRRDVAVFHQADLFTTTGRFQVFDGDGLLLLRDTHHLSYHGSDLAARRLFTQPGVVATPGAAQVPGAGHG
ncbi:MAG: acyltransferase family protein [Burkholderiaceae bacterium]